MAIDASIALGVQPFKAPDQMNMLAQIMGIQQAQNQNALAQYGLAKAQREDSETTALNDAYKSALGPDGTVDRTRLYSTLAERNVGSRIPTIQKQFLDADTAQATLGKTKAEQAKLELEAGIKKTEHVAAVLSLATDPVKYAAIRPLVKAQWGQDLPEQYDPGMVQAIVAQGQTITDRLKAEHDRLTLAETGRHNLSTEQNAAGQLTEAKRHNTQMEGFRSTEVGAAALSQPFTVAGQDGKDVLVQQDKRTGKLIPVQGGYGPKGSEKAMTEDQGKATGWLIQAENAWANMRNVAIGPDGKINTKVTSPGAAEIAANIPGLGGLANAGRPEDRQKFIQATSSLSEALLRAATGAGVNKEEAEQKVKELTPVWGEKPGVTQQKFDSIPLYIESLKVRAGPGAAKAAQVLNGGQKTVVRTGTLPDGRKVVQYSDGTTDYAN